MKSLPVFVCILCFFLTACQPTSPSAGPNVEHVIILGVDGMSPSGIQRATTPNFNRVIRDGAFTFKARGVLGTSSSQNWASMIMGAGPEQHGVTSNGWERDSHSIEPTATGLEDIFPTIFGLVRMQIPGATIASIYDWSGFGRLYEQSVMTYDINPDGPRETMSVATMLIEQRELPTFTFIHLDHVDGAGHTYGHGSDEYFAAVELADSLLGNLLHVLDTGNHWDNTLLIISADHGGVGTRHGGESMQELEIPWMALGAGVAAGKQIIDPVDTYDTAATVAYALDLDPPYAWIGRPVTSAFEGNADHVTLKEPLPPFVPMPRLHPPAGQIAGEGLTLDVTVDHPDAEIHYTLDGSEPDQNASLFEGPMALTEPTLLKAKAFTADGGRSGLSEAEYLSPENGVRYSYYEGDWQTLPDFESIDPVRVAEIARFDLAGVEKREDHYSILFDSDLQIDEAGSYTFELMSDDGSMMWIDGKPLIDLNSAGGARTKEGTIELTAGRHHVEVGYFETYGDNVLDVRYAGPGFGKQQIPARKLFKR